MAWAHRGNPAADDGAHRCSRLRLAAGAGASAGRCQGGSGGGHQSQRRLFLFRDGRVVASYRIALGGNPVGPKIFEGDGRTPEGAYVLADRNENSRFHRSIRISYPSPADRQRAWKYGGPPGGDIMIHGQPGPGNKSALKRIALAPSSWTDGCIAVDNAAMDQIWGAVDDGTPIEILP